VNDNFNLHHPETGDFKFPGPKKELVNESIQVSQMYQSHMLTQQCSAWSINIKSKTIKLDPL
jgi:hypothetical protein